MHVLKAPHKHIPLELRKARDFGVYVSERLLFAGLIFTLANVARALALGAGAVESGALEMSLTSALYALIMYWAVARRTAAAVCVL